MDDNLQELWDQAPIDGPLPKVCINCCFWATFDGTHGDCCATDDSQPERMVSIKILRSLEGEPNHFHPLTEAEHKEMGLRACLVTPAEFSCDSFLEKDCE